MVPLESPRPATEFPKTLQNGHTSARLSVLLCCVRMPVTDQSGEQTEVTRRKLYVATIYGLWSLIAAALYLPAAIYFS